MIEKYSTDLLSYDSGTPMTTSESGPQAIPAEVQRRLQKASELEEEGRRATYTGIGRWVIGGVAVSWSLFQLYTASFGFLPAIQQRAVHLTFALVLIFLLHPFRRHSRSGLRWTVDLLCLSAGLFVGIFIVWDYEDLIYRAGSWEPLDLAASGILVLLVLEMARRTIGLALPLVALGFLLYAYFGAHLPGPLGHRGYTIQRIVSEISLTTEGIFGIPLAASATIMMAFIIFATFLRKSGAGTLFADFAQALFGWMRGGAAKVSVVSSALFGTISGSAVANVVVDGYITIPLMARTGYQRHVAAAIEAVASTGGQLMPPVMGAAAFVMAEMLNVEYAAIIRAAIFPAILYYVSLFCMVDFEARRKGIKALRRSELPHLGSVIRQYGHLSIPLFLLIYMLGWADWTPTRAALWALICTVVVSLIRSSTRMTPARILAALEEGALGTLEVASACACAGIIIGVVMLTGLGLRISGILVDFAGGNLLLLLLLAAIASLILGMGIATTATYILVAILVAPAVTSMGVPPIAGHMFAFYFGIIAAITPPVALASYAAAGVGGTDPVKTGFVGMKYASAGFIVPFMFVFGPELLLIGRWTEIVLAIVSSTIGVIALAAGLQGYLLRKAGMVDRALLILGSLFLIFPGLTTDLVGLGLVLTPLFRQWRSPKLAAAIVPDGQPENPQNPKTDPDSK